ncbi:hypothetical protein NL676_012185 [Syzygium grande]|nr:hypothetical protein NL676_012185 [Syzygium grande]
MDTDVFEFIDRAITIAAALDCPKDFLSLQGRIAERLFAGRQRSAVVAQSTVKKPRRTATRVVLHIKYALSDDIEEASQVVEFYGLSGFWTIVDITSVP